MPTEKTPFFTLAAALLRRSISSARAHVTPSPSSLVLLIVLDALIYCRSLRWLARGLIWNTGIPRQSRAASLEARDLFRRPSAIMFPLSICIALFASVKRTDMPVYRPFSIGPREQIAVAGAFCCWLGFYYYSLRYGRSVLRPRDGGDWVSQISVEEEKNLFLNTFQMNYSVVYCEYFPTIKSIFKN